MKPKILIILLLLAAGCQPAEAFMGIHTACGGSGESAPSGCNTPSTGSELNEGFLGTGYENTWTETIGANGVVNEDATLTGTPPAGSCTEGLYIDCNGAPTRTRWDRGSAIDTSETSFDVYFSFRVNSITLDNYGYAAFVIWSIGTDPGTQTIWYAQFRNNNGTYQVRINSTVDSTLVTIATGTWYEAIVHSDATPANSYFQLTGGGTTTCDTAGECLFTTSENSDGRYLHLGNNGDVGAGERFEIEFGYVYVNIP